MRVLGVALALLIGVVTPQARELSGQAPLQEEVVPWTIVDGPKSAEAFAAKLMATPRLATGPNASAAPWPRRTL